MTLPGKKAFIIGVLMFLLNFTFLLFVIFTTAYNKKTYEDMGNILSDGRQSNPYKLSISEIKSIQSDADHTIKRLKPLNDLFTFGALVGVIIIVWHLLNYQSGAYRFDGLTLLIVGLATLGVPLLQLHFAESYSGGVNATNNLRIWLNGFQLILLPVIFYWSYRLNKVEILNNLHQKKWISILSFTFFILFGIIAVVIGLGLLFKSYLYGKLN